MLSCMYMYFKSKKIVERKASYSRLIFKLEHEDTDIFLFFFIIVNNCGILHFSFFFKYIEFSIVGILHFLILNNFGRLHLCMFKEQDSQISSYQEYL